MCSDVENHQNDRLAQKLTSAAGAAIGSSPILGYEPSMSARGVFGSLLLAAYRGDDLVYVGSEGTGFD